MLHKLEGSSGDLILSGDLNIETPKKLQLKKNKKRPQKQTGDTALVRLKQNLEGLKVEGGLWLCPHIPAVSRFFCTKLDAFLCDAGKTTWEKDYRFACGTRGARFDFRWHGSNVIVSIMRKLGSIEMMLYSPNGLDHIIKHLSTRIPQARTEIERKDGRDASRVCHLHGLKD